VGIATHVFIKIDSFCKPIGEYMLQTAFKYDLEVTQLPVPFQVGTLLTIFVISEQPADKFDDLLAAAQSSTDFLDNPFDDEDWNHI